MLSVLIAKNGTGKTTLLNAITWCLYGKELHLDKEKTALPIVNSAVSRSAQVGEILPVKVTVTVIDESTIIEFQRETRFKVLPEQRVLPGNTELRASITPLSTAASSFSNTAIKTGADAEILVKQYFDEAIFKFYFFDGEKLREFFTASQANSIQQSIFNISQVTLLENSCQRLYKMHSERTKKLAKDSPDIAALNKKQETLENRMALAQSTLDDCRGQVDELTRERERLDDILRGYEPVKKLQEERYDLESELSALEIEESQFKTNRAAFIRQYTVLITLYPRIARTLAMIKEKEDDGDLPPAIDKNQIRLLLDHLDLPCPICNGHIGEKGRQHLESLLERLSVSSATSNYLKEIKGSLEVYIDQVKEFKHKLADLRQLEINLSARKNEITSRLQEIASALSNFDSDGGSVNVAQVEEKRSGIIHQINTANQNIGASKETLKSCEEQLSEVEAERSAALKKMSEHKDIRRQITVIDMLYSAFKRLKADIMDEMKKEIEQTTWEYFDRMIWKKNTFGSIAISDSYDISVFNKDNVEMTGSLSATEQMALAYAFTLAIHKASGKNCPLVIDSPLGRVSDENRENMAAALREVSAEKQIIMLFTPDEYSDSVKKIYSPVAEVRELALSDDEDFVEGIEH